MMKPTLGTSGTLLSGMTWTWAETWRSPSVLTIGGGGGVWPREMLRHERGESDRGGDRRECHAHDVLPSVIPARFAVEGAEAP